MHHLYSCRQAVGGRDADDTTQEMLNTVPSLILSMRLLLQESTKPMPVNAKLGPTGLLAKCRAYFEEWQTLAVTSVNPRFKDRALHTHIISPYGELIQTGKHWANQLLAAVGELAQLTHKVTRQRCIARVHSLQPTAGGHPTDKGKIWYENIATKDLASPGVLIREFEATLKEAPISLTIDKDIKTWRQDSSSCMFGVQYCCIFQ